MPILSDILALLRRPIAPLPPAVANKGKAKPIAADDVPLTEAELVEALERCRQERAEAWTIIDTVGDRREELLLQDGTDDTIAALGRQVDSANLLLERLDRVEPDLRHRLEDIRAAAKARHFLDLRDAYVAAGRRYIEYVHGLNAPAEYAAPLLALGRLVTAFPDVKGHVPAPPLLPGVTEFEAKLREFSHLALDPRPKSTPRPTAANLSRNADAEQMGEVTATWGTGAVVGAQPHVRVELLAGELDSEGVWQKIGSVILLRGDEAERRVQSGRAKIHEPEGGA